jgi:hypothetical protein
MVRILQGDALTMLNRRYQLGTVKSNAWQYMSNGVDDRSRDYV